MGHHGNRRLIRAGSRTTRPSLTSAPRPVTTGRAAPLAERRRISMDLETAIQAFGSAGHDLPHEVLQWTLDHWEEVAPELLGMLERYISGADRSDEAARAIFFILHLAGEKQDTRVFPLLCRLAQDGEAVEAALGDDTTTTLKRILISTYNGDFAALTTLIEAAEADEFIRAAHKLAQSAASQILLATLTKKLRPCAGSGSRLRAASPRGEAG